MPKKAGPVRSSGYSRPGGGSKTGIKAPGAGGGQRPGAVVAGGGPTAAAAAAAAAAADNTKGGRQFEKNQVFELPAISVLMQKKTDLGAEWMEKRKKKMVRQNVPAGEDTNKLKEIVRSLKDQEINVHEFVGLVAPSTGDQALCMRNILAEEMATFRKMCRRVYDTMSQDVSDVLANEQVQVADNCTGRMASYSDKMMRSIDEIFAFIPDFDFEQYYEHEDYLEKKFPLCVAEIGNSEEEEILMRQEAFHRFQWLRSEGDRLGAENTRLLDRLNLLKRQQKEELCRAQEIQAQNEEKREELEATEDALQEKVEELNKSIEQLMVQNEVNVVKNLKKAAMRKRGSMHPKDLKRKKVDTRPDWNVGAAQEVEELATEEATQGQISQVSMSAREAPSASTGAIRKVKQPAGKKKSRFQRPPPPPQQADPFHYSPPKTPPGYGQQQQPTSPFHYSPDRRPPSPSAGALRRASPGQSRSPQRTVRMETSTTVMEPTRIPTGPRYSHHNSASLW